ncbi:hypothetical protein BRPE64_BCDS04760 [Caballeronia insecticola]|uniref:Uncharacterized protein n=1 Tax=Caballeronia insecticola TaxID=758793 RepID=R4X1N7_9BURK|nr:hypothetical protein BRPE64_BCDS04760 [Caballeronia insecticola]
MAACAGRLQGAAAGSFRRRRPLRFDLGSISFWQMKPASLPFRFH